MSVRSTPTAPLLQVRLIGPDVLVNRAAAVLGYLTRGDLKVATRTTRRTYPAQRTGHVRLYLTVTQKVDEAL